MASPQTPGVIFREKAKDNPAIIVSPPARNLEYILSVNKPTVIQIKPSPIKPQKPVKTKGENTDTGLELIGRKLSNIAIELESLSSTPKLESEVFDPLPQFPYDENNLKSALLCQEHQYQLNALKQIRKYLCEDDVNNKAHQILSLSLLPLILPYLSTEIPIDLAYEACWCMTNIAAGRTEYTAPLVESGCIPKLASLLNSTNSDIKSQAAWAIGNIAGDCEQYRDLVMEVDGIVSALVGVATGSYPNHQKSRNAKQ